MKTVVVIPAMNEGKNIGKVIEDVKKYVKDIIVVDDGSSDNTFNEAKKHGIKVLKHIINLGKGAALKTGCDYAVMKGYEQMIVMDADGQHEAKLIPDFLKALEEADLVFGYRRFSSNMPFLFRAGNHGINKLTQFLYGINIRDTQSGFRAFKSETYKKIRWNSNDYSMESEMIANAGKHHVKYKEIPITTIYVDRHKGTTIIDGIKIGINMIKWKLGLK